MTAWGDWDPSKSVRIPPAPFVITTPSQLVETPSQLCVSFLSYTLAERRFESGKRSGSRTKLGVFGWPREILGSMEMRGFAWAVASAHRSRSV